MRKLKTGSMHIYVFSVKISSCLGFCIHCSPVNSLWPSEAIWQHGSGSTLAQVMACCLMAPSHYLNQCWLTTSKIEWHSSRDNFARDTSAINHWNYLKNQVPKMSFKFLRGQISWLAQDSSTACTIPQLWLPKADSVWKDINWKKILFLSFLSNKPWSQ